MSSLPLMTPPMTPHFLPTAPKAAPPHFSFWHVAFVIVGGVDIGVDVDVVAWPFDRHKCWKGCCWNDCQATCCWAHQHLDFGMIVGLLLGVWLGTSLGVLIG